MTIGRYTIYWRNGITYRLGRRWWYTPAKGSINGLLILGRIGVRWREHKPIQWQSPQVIPTRYEGMPWDSNNRGTMQRITKREWIGRGGLRNSRLFRRMRGGRWKYYKV